MPKAARERVASPPAGTAPSPRALACQPDRVRIMGEVHLYVTETGTNVNRPVTAYFSEFVIARLDPAIHRAASLHGPPGRARG